MIKFLNFEAFKGVVRHLLTSAGAVLTTNGYLEASQTEAFVGAAMFFIGLAWSIVQKKAS